MAGLRLAYVLEHRTPQLAGGTWLDPPRGTGTFTLVDDTGRTYTQAQLQGTPTLVFFGFTHCPDVCPTTLYKLAQLERAGVVPHLKVVFVSVDPARDTPAALKQYVSAFGAPALIGVTGPERAIATVAAHFGVAYERVPLPGGDYTIDHSAVVFLLDRAARVVAVFTAPFDTKVLRADLARVAPRLER